MGVANRGFHVGVACRRWKSASCKLRPSRLKLRLRLVARWAGHPLPLAVSVRPVVLRDVLARVYGLELRQSALAPAGFTGSAWLLETDAGPMIAKVSADTESAIRTATLLTAMADDVLPGRLPQPLSTLAGEPGTDVDGQCVTVLTYVDGQTPSNWPDWPQQVLVPLGRLLAAVHARTASLPPAPSQRDPFDCSVAEELRTAVTALSTAPADAPWRAMVDVLAAHRHALDEQLRRLEILSRTARQRGADRLVLCHTDVAGDNVVVDGATIGLLDWDEAALGPVEADLLLTARDQRDPTPLRHLLTGYRELFPRIVVDRDVLTFLLLRRALEDVAARIALVTGNNSGTDPRRQTAAKDVLTWGVEVWQRMDTTVALAAASAS
jgi:Ser/Thr protein kinase RdoA (MazF antagonist)